jgi:N-acetylmuramoyl-L-alanine amidase
MAKKILVQMGHVAPRQPGHDGQTGANGEQELVKKIGPLLAALLNADPAYDALLVPGWIKPGTKCDAAIFLHGDGSGSSSTRGFCYGYPVHPVNAKLRNLLKAEYEKIPGHPPHRADNYTADLRGYYGYAYVDTDGPEVLVEHGFLSNPTDRKWMFANVEKIAKAHYEAVRLYFKSKPPAAKKPVYDVRALDATGKIVKRWPRSREPAVELAEWNVYKHKPKRVTIDRVD